MKKSISFTQLSICLLLGMMAEGLSACNPQKKANSNQLEFWTMQLQPTFTEYFTNINQTFEAQNKAVKLRWVDVSWSAMENKILTSISAKSAPDVVNLNPKFASQLATRNAWLDLEPMVTPEVKATYLPKIWQASSIEVCQGGSPANSQENSQENSPAKNCQQQTFGLPGI